MSEIQAFLCNNGPDHKGRTWQEIVQLDDQMWDECHDFIQWLFPLPVESKHAAYSPVLVEQDLSDLWENAQVQANLVIFAKRFCEFLGINIHTPFGGPTPKRYRVSLQNNGFKTFSQQYKYWLRANDHNHLRINRMLQSLVLFGLDNLAREIFRCLVMIKCEFNDCITDETMVYWRNALTGYSY